MICGLFLKGEQGERGPRGQPGVMGPVGKVGSKVGRKKTEKEYHYVEMLDLKYSIACF